MENENIEPPSKEQIADYILETWAPQEIANLAIDAFAIRIKTVGGDELDQAERRIRISIVDCEVFFRAELNRRLKALRPDDDPTPIERDRGNILESLFSGGSKI